MVTEDFTRNRRALRDNTRDAMNPGPDKASWVVCQLGARMHYAVPRILQEADLLERFCTDICADHSWPRLLQLIPNFLRPVELKRLIGRKPEIFSMDRTVSYPWFGLAYYLRRHFAMDLEALSEVHLWAGTAFGNRVVTQGFGRAGAVYAFNTAALEILAAARHQGLFTVLEQTIAPRMVEDQLLAQEQALFPEWEPHRITGGAATRTAQREAKEWALSDLIVCGSEFVREGIAKAGGPVERCVVVPYGVDSRFAAVKRERSRGRLRVLTVGEVSLRKGAPHLLQLAGQLRDQVEFRWVGGVLLTAEGRRKMEKEVTLMGAVPRSSIFSHYEWADVFFLPSLCEGSATVLYEALSTGLPVLTTPNAGSPVRDGEDGFVIPMEESGKMKDLLLRLHRDRSFLEEISENASTRAGDLSLVSYQSRLLKELTGTRTPAAPIGEGGEWRTPSGRDADAQTPASERPWVVCQVGAREYYVVPRALEQKGQLATLVTDIWVKPGVALRALHSRVSNRYHPELGHASVQSWTARALAHEVSQVARFRGGWKRIMMRNAWFQRCALETLPGIRFEPGAAPVLFAYSYAARDLFRWARSQGWTTILGQIDPGPPAAATGTSPSWDRSPAPAEYWELWREECELSDAIVVNSNWSLQCLIKAGVPQEKLHLIPLAFSPAQSMQPLSRDYPSAFTPERPLRVLYLGNLIPRKGIEEIFESAAVLRNEPVEFTLVGRRGSGVRLPRPGVPNVKFHKNVSRALVSEFYRKSDVFLFPSHSDGFGLTQLEAQACALPVIASRCCGEVVRHGENGLLLNEVTANEITAALRLCLASPDRLREMSECSRVEPAFQFSSLNSRLNALVKQLQRNRAH